MNKRPSPLITILTLGVLWHLSSHLSLAEQSFGIAPLYSLTSPHTSVSPDTRPLLTAAQQEAFLTELERSVPNWLSLQDQPGEEHGERLFNFNRMRDEIRDGHDLLRQRIAFLWSGILREFQAEHRGFKIAMGPELTQTHWGIVRFKPVNLPQEMVAVPTSTLLPILKKRVRAEKSVEISILFSGTLIANESVMYSFSHDNPDEGMILPFVLVDKVQYFVKKRITLDQMGN